MTAAEFVLNLDGVHSRGIGRWSALCPAHADKSPSLSISEGDKGILLKCWAGCSLASICAVLHIEQRELFFDALDPDPQRRMAAWLQRDRQRRAHARHEHQQGALIDALREADYFVLSRRGLDISKWSHTRLNKELNALADAYHLLDHENLYG